MDRNNLQPRAGFAYALNDRSVVRGGIGRYYEKLFNGQASPLQGNGVLGDSFIVNFPVAAADPGPSNGRLPTDPMLVGGPVVNRTLLNRLYPPGTLTRNTATVQYDTPAREMPRSTQLSFGYERQIGATMSIGADFVHNEGRGWLAYDLNPGLRVNTTRTGAIVRTDLLGLAGQLGLSAVFEQRVVSVRRFRPIRSTTASTCLWSGAIGASGAPVSATRWGTPAAITAARRRRPIISRCWPSVISILGYGPLDTDRRHNLTVNGRLEVPHTKGLTVSALFRYMTGRPFTIMDSTVDADRNGILFDPLPPGTYSGVGTTAITAESEGGRNGAYGPDYAQLDVRIGYRIRPGKGRTLDLFLESFNLTNRSNYTNPPSDKRLPTFLVLNGLVAGGFPRQVQLGIRLGF